MYFIVNICLTIYIIYTCINALYRLLFSITEQVEKIISLGSLFPNFVTWFFFTKGKILFKKTSFQPWLLYYKPKDSLNIIKRL